MAQAGYKPANVSLPDRGPREPGFLAQGLRGIFGRDEIEPLLAHRQDPRITTSRLLPEILRLRSKGLSYRRIGQRLELSARQVEQVLSRHRKLSGQ